MPTGEKVPHAPSLRVVHVDADHCLMVAPPLLISIENSDPHLPHLDRVSSAAQNLAPKETRRAGVLVIIRDNARPPGDAARARIVRLFTEFEGRVGAFAYAMEGEGFAAAAKRSALALILTVKRVGFPMKVVKSASEAIPWLVTTLGGEKATGIATDRLIIAVRNAREQQYALARKP